MSKTSNGRTCLRCEEKETISDEVILEQFDWFVEGVRIYEK